MIAAHILPLMNSSMNVRVLGLTTIIWYVTCVHVLNFMCSNRRATCMSNVCCNWIWCEKQLGRLDTSHVTRVIGRYRSTTVCVLCWRVGLLCFKLLNFVIPLMIKCVLLRIELWNVIKFQLCYLLLSITRYTCMARIVWWHLTDETTQNMHTVCSINRHIASGWSLSVIMLIFVLWTTNTLSSGRCLALNLKCGV